MKNIRIALMACLACLFATACQQEDEGDQVFTTNRFRVEAPQFTDANGSKVYLNYSDAGSKLIYEEGDRVYVNGHEFTLTKDGSTWYANSTDGNPVVGKRFLVAYADGAVSAFDSAAGTYHYNLNTNLADAAHNKIVLGGTSASGTVLTLSPACAILRLNTQGAGRNYSYVKVGFEANKIPKQGTLNVSTRAINAGGNYMSPVMSNGTGDFLNMRYSNPSSTGEDDYWYVAIPIEGSSVTTTLYLEWNNGSTTIRYKTQAPVTLQKGYVYTVGTERVSPFTTKGVGKYFFNVSGSSQVAFTAGNLQCQRYYDMDSYSYKYKWQFAPTQLTVAGTNNNNIGSNGVWFDLFGYGTSGWNSGATAYTPSAVSTTNSDYYSSNLTSSNADWGVYNSTSGIYYGSVLCQTPPTYRTLTSDEWSYLINRSGKAGLVMIDGAYFGLMLLPNSGQNGVGTWTNTTDVNLSGLRTSSTMNLTLQEWDKLEAIGAIFLPASGTRTGTTAQEVNSIGQYWSASSYNAANGKILYFDNSGAVSANTVDDISGKSVGCAVRLVISIG